MFYNHYYNDHNDYNYNYNYNYNDNVADNVIMSIIIRRQKKLCFIKDIIDHLLFYRKPLSLVHVEFYM